MLCSKELVISVWYQTTLNCSAKDSEPMLGTNAANLKVNTSGRCRRSKTNKLNFSRLIQIRARAVTSQSDSSLGTRVIGSLD